MPATLVNITDAVQEAKNGSHKVRITFEKSAEKTDVYYLLGMKRNGIIAFQNPMDEAVMMAVAQSGDWEHDDNRTLTLTLTETFDAEWFIGRMRRCLENIEVVT